MSGIQLGKIPYIRRQEKKKNKRIKSQKETNKRKKPTDHEILKFKVCDLKISMINTFKKKNSLEYFTQNGINK